MTAFRLYLWELIGSSPVFAGVAACISIAAGHFFTARSRLIGIFGSLYLGLVAWTTASQGFPFPFGVMTTENKRDLAIIAVRRLYRWNRHLFNQVGLRHLLDAG
jgi:hypothetical protein